MQFALSNAVNRVIPIPPPLRFTHPRSSHFPPVPEFRTASRNQFFEEFDRVEVEIQTTITDQESKGVRPFEKQRPWSKYPFGRRTHSQEQFAKRHAQREEFLEKRRQEQAHELLVSAAVEATLTPIPLHRPTREDNDNTLTSKRSLEQAPPQLETITETDRQEDNDRDGPPPQSLIYPASVEKRKGPLYYPEPYYFPNVPPLPSFGQGLRKIPTYLRQWLEDKPGFTKKNFWDCQMIQHKYAVTPANVTGDDRPEMDNEPERFQDAQE